MLFNQLHYNILCNTVVVLQTSLYPIFPAFNSSIEIHFESKNTGLNTHTFNLGESEGGLYTYLIIGCTKEHSNHHMLVFASSFTSVYILDTEQSLLSTLAHKDRAKGTISVWLGEWRSTPLPLQESKLWLFAQQAVFLTAIPASRQMRFNCLTTALCSWQSVAEAPFVVHSIINKEWRSPGEQTHRCRQYQSPQMTTIMCVAFHLTLMSSNHELHYLWRDLHRCSKGYCILILT